MKEEVILRILAKESLDLELLFKRYGPFWNYFTNARGLSAKSGPRVDFPRVQGPFCKISEITRNNELFFNG
jgi:hypothetical protein